MKKTIGLLSAFILFMLLAKAQQNSTGNEGISFGIRAGVNFQNITGKDANGDKLDNKLVPGFNMGVTAQIPVAPQFYFQPGLLYSVKGAKNSDVILGQTIESKIKIAYVELPLNLLFKPVLGTGHLLLGFGPYVALGVGGKVKYTGGETSSSQDIEFKKTVTASDPQNVAYFRPMDAGANLLAGYEFSNKLSFQLNAQLGMTKINPTYNGAGSDKTSAKNTGFGLSLGYRF